MVDAKWYIVLFLMPLLLHGQGGTARLSNTPSRSAAECPPLAAADRAKVREYVRKLMKAPDGTRVELTDWPTEGQSCFRKLDFSVDGTSRVVLYLDPDQRFLAPQLWDTQLDPEKAEAEETARVREKINSYLSAHNTPLLGRKDAPITIAVFSDFQCPFCRKAIQVLTKDVLPVAGDQVRLAYLHYPIASHPWARPAADAAECLRESPAFWRITDFIFEHQAELNPRYLSRAITDYVGTLAESDVEVDAARACVASGKAASNVDEDSTLGRALNVSATPTLFINGERLVGVKNADEVERVISRQRKAIP
jgi:protein-disulfide isomerase